MKNLSTLIVVAIVLSGCVGAAVESARITNDTAIRKNNMDAAQKGNAEAQYKVGKSYCCAPRNDVDGFYNNQKATIFLCKAARQHHAQAAYELGKIYSGDTIDGVRLLRRVATAARGENITNKTIAYYWFKQAELNGHADVNEELEDLGLQNISSFTDPLTAPCTLSEVIGDIK